LSAAITTAPPRLNVRVCLDSPVGKTDPEIRAGVGALAERLRELGHHVETVAPPVIDAANFVPVYSRIFADIPVLFPSMLQPVTRWFREEGKRTTHTECREAHARFAAIVDDWYGDAEILLTPTTAIPSPRVGAYDHLEPAAMWEAVGPLGAFTAGFNIGGHPALSVPVGHTSEGLPIGAQLVGRRGHDAELMALGRELEVAIGGFDPLRNG